MELEYFLFCKEQYEEQIRNIDNILHSQYLINKHNELSSNLGYISTINQNHYTSNSNQSTNMFIEHRHFLCQLKELCDQHIRMHCKHDFVDDYIDISPECSQKITYCSICELTK